MLSTRLASQRSLRAGFAGRGAATASPYDASYSYDANGNLLNLTRNSEASEIQDDFVYQYYEGTNKLRALAEGAADAYIYDEIGNLVEDVTEGTTIEWTPYGKIRTVTKANDNLTIHYRYDAAGNRVEKKTVKDGEVTTNRYIRDASGNVMAVYRDTVSMEHHIYGSSRLGLALEKSKPGQLKLGHRQYELSNHLGNVLAVITDNVNMVNNAENSEWYDSKAWPTLVKTNDYYPFGLQMAGRTTDGSGYRYGFNGKEIDNWSSEEAQAEVTAFGPPGPPPAPDDNPDTGTNNSSVVYDYGFRIYNPRIAKFLSVDPLTNEYPWYTPYQFAGNTPIQAIDVDGLEPEKVTEKAEEFLDTPYEYGGKNPQFIGGDLPEGKDNDWYNRYVGEGSRNVGAFNNPNYNNSINLSQYLADGHTSCGIDCSGLAGTSFNADEEKSLADFDIYNQNAAAMRAVFANADISDGYLSYDLTGVAQGDLVFNGSAGHVYVATGNTRRNSNDVLEIEVTHSPETGRNVITEYKTIGTGWSYGRSARRQVNADDVINSQSDKKNQIMQKPPKNKSKSNAISDLVKLFLIQAQKRK